MEDGAVGGAFLAEDAQDVGVGLAVVDDQGLVVALGEFDVGAEGAFLGGHAFGAGAEVVEAGFAHAEDVGEGGQCLDLVEGLVEGGFAACGAFALAGPAVGVAEDDAGASLGWRATAAWTRSWAAAASAAQREPARSQPTWIRVVTPTEAALARVSSIESACMSTWVWLSATSTVSASGSGGAS